MILHLILLSSISFFTAYAEEANNIIMSVSAVQNDRMPCSIVTVQLPAKYKTFVTTLLKDLNFSQQLDATVNTVTSYEQFEQNMRNNVYAPLAIVVQKSGKGISCALYDTENKTRVAEHARSVTKKDGRIAAHRAADALWPHITGIPGWFNTRIAYIKETPGAATNRPYKHVMVTEYDGTAVHDVTSEPMVANAPRWNNDMHNPLLFYSEFTPNNVRLKVVNKDGMHKVASDFEGINMQPTFADDKQMVYVASRGKGDCSLYYYKGGKLEKLTTASGANYISPTLSKDGQNLFYCSDESGRPQIYQMHIPTRYVTQITFGTASMSPAYSDRAGMLAYVQNVNGCLQVCTYDISSGKHRQLTTDSADKEECAWSPCGSFLLYQVNSAQGSRIAQYNVLSGQRRYITAATDKCSFPAWSPHYAIDGGIFA